MNAYSTPVRYRLASWPSRTNDCTVAIAPIDSCTCPETCASSSWTARVIRRILRPNTIVVTTVTGTMVSISSVSFTSITNSSTSAPNICTPLRSAIDSSVLTTP